MSFMSEPAEKSNPLTHEAITDLSNKLQLLFEAIKDTYGIRPPPMAKPQEEPVPARRMAVVNETEHNRRSTVQETPSGTTTFGPNWNSAPDGAPEPVTTSEAELETEEESYQNSIQAHDVNLQVRFMLQAAPEGLPMRALVEGLAKDYTESVVISSVKHLVEAGDIARSGAKRGTRYHMAPISAAPEPA